MKQKIFTLLSRCYTSLRRHKYIVAGGVAAIVLSPCLLIVACHFIISNSTKYILTANEHKQIRVGLVLGAGVNKQGKPYKELQARLDAAAQALQTGQIDRVILSGDNRFKGYNEPAAMVNYLVTIKHIDKSKLQPDFAGRSTYESCERASKIFGLKQTIIYSARSHLPRAIYLCRHFGIEAYGVSSGVEANNSRRRELLADVKAIFNEYIYGERTVLGKPIKV